MNSPDEASVIFNDGPAYERFMGRWSQFVGKTFLDWVAPPGHAHWLELGCGTGAFTELVLNTCFPAAAVAIDPSAQQIDYARRQSFGHRADFRTADACALPFADSSFDVVASALVLNFIADRELAMRETKRVAHPGAIVAGYVWDFSQGRAPNSLLARGLRCIGIEAPKVFGADESSVNALQTLFQQAGFAGITTRSIDVTMTFANFPEFWRSQTPSFSPLTKIIAGLGGAARANLIEWLQTELSVSPQGEIALEARANAIKAVVPK